jgi:hypothetical protein
MRESVMQKMYTILDVLNENLDDIINSGIEAGAKLARDTGIDDFTLTCQVSNRDSSEIESYKTRLMNKELTDDDNAIISKYQDL